MFGSVPVSIQKKLQDRADIDNQDIPEIIHRAEQLRQQHISSKVSIDSVLEIGKELDIEQQFVEQAVSAMRAEREQSENTKPSSNPY